MRHAPKARFKKWEMLAKARKALDEKLGVRPFQQKILDAYPACADPQKGLDEYQARAAPRGSRALPGPSIRQGPFSKWLEKRNAHNHAVEDKIHKLLGTIRKSRAVPKKYKGVINDAMRRAYQDAEARGALPGLKKDAEELARAKYTGIPVVIDDPALQAARDAAPGRMAGLEALLDARAAEARAEDLGPAVVGRAAKIAQINDAAKAGVPVYYQYGKDGKPVEIGAAEARGVLPGLKKDAPPLHNTYEIHEPAAPPRHTDPEAGACPACPADQSLKKDAGKVPLELLSEKALIEIAKVLQFGASKYSPDGWRAGMAWRRLIGAALRHLLAFSQGEDKDPETGLSHLAHLGCCTFFLLEYSLTGNGQDDRYKGKGK